MKNEPRLLVNNVSKRYWLFRRYRDRLLQALAAPILQRDFSESFWALKNISFQLKPGEVIGVIGINGSGKSTLLQIIAGTLRPTSGSVVQNGRLTALLELGAGFHPEFTGRENIFLSGAVMGITEDEMKRRFNEIVEFADIGEFINQPVKLYSSGMFVRLAFSVATCVNPDILVVDEALAVGDAGFVIKCMNRMSKLREQGTAIVLVTHDVQTVRSICDYAIWLNRGETHLSGKPIEVTSRYLEQLYKKTVEQTENSSSPVSILDRSLEVVDSWFPIDPTQELRRWGTGKLKIIALRVTHQDEQASDIVKYGEFITISIRVAILEHISNVNLGFGLSFRNMKGLDVITSTTLDQEIKFPELGQGDILEIEFVLENILSPGEYSIVVNAESRLLVDQPEYLDFVENARILRVVSDKHIFSQVLPWVNHKYRIISTSLPELSDDEYRKRN